MLEFLVYWYWGKLLSFFKVDVLDIIKCNGIFKEKGSVVISLF